MSDFQTKIVNAVVEMQKGSPIKDYLSDQEIGVILRKLKCVYG